MHRESQSYKGLCHILKLSWNFSFCAVSKPPRTQDRSDGKHLLTVNAVLLWCITRHKPRGTRPSAVNLLVSGTVSQIGTSWKYPLISLMFSKRQESPVFIETDTLINPPKQKYNGKSPATLHPVSNPCFPTSGVMYQKNTTFLCLTSCFTSAVSNQIFLAWLKTFPKQVKTSISFYPWEMNCWIFSHRSPSKCSACLF